MRSTETPRAPIARSTAIGLGLVLVAAAGCHDTAAGAAHGSTKPPSRPAPKATKAPAPAPSPSPPSPTPATSPTSPAPAPPPFGAPNPNDPVLAALRGMSIPHQWGPVATVLPHGRVQTEGPWPIPSDVEHAAPITAGDGGVLRLARSRDGRTLFFRRDWDDGSADLARFDARPDGTALPDGVVLQFVDGLSRWQGTIGAPPREDPDHRRTYRTSRGMYDQRLEVWWIDTAHARAIRPWQHQVYPLVPARGRYDAAAARRLQWMAFGQSCPGLAHSCVYYGRPSAVCGRVLDAKVDDDFGQSLWIAPRHCAGH